VKLLLACGLIAGILIATIVPAAEQSTPTPGVCSVADMTACDVNLDGRINLTDLGLVKSFSGAVVGTPFPCVGLEVFVTPVDIFDAQGTPVGNQPARLVLQPDDARWTPVLAGTSVAFRPC
jgi:hypothetical protein